MDEHERQDAYRSSELDTHLDVLSAHPRRVVLSALRDHSPRDESDFPIRGREQPNRVKIELQHVHLPKLDDAGYIEWNRDTGTVSTGPRYSDIEPLLGLIENCSDDLPADTH